MHRCELRRAQVARASHNWRQLAVQYRGRCLLSEDSITIFLSRISSMHGRILSSSLALLVCIGNGVISHVNGFSGTGFISKKNKKNHHQQKNSLKKDSMLPNSSSIPNKGVAAKRSALFAAGGADTVVEEPSTKRGKILEALTKFSNFASMLCVIDCTVLPAVTVLLPLIGLAASPAQSIWLHELGHKVALFFVLPVGSLASSLGYVSHRKKSYLMCAVFGLALIYASNGHGGPILSLIPHELGHSIHAGVLHRPSNILGCAFLLGSNYLSRKLSHGDCCDHSHGHSHDH